MAIRNLVTGGAGFIGQHIVNRLLDRGEFVRVLDLSPPRTPNADVEWIQGSITDSYTVKKALKGIHRVYHLAANPNLWAPDKRIFEAVNHQGTRILLNETKRQDVERIVYTSTESILTTRKRRRQHANSSIVPETMVPQLKDMPGPYCRSKLLAERLAFSEAAAGQPIIIVTPTLPIGPGDHNLTPPTQMLLRFATGNTLAYLECGLNMVDVRDVAMGHVLAADRGRVGERYILGNRNLMLSEYLAMVQHALGIRKRLFRVPYWLALGTAVVSECVADLTKRPPIAPLTGVRLMATPLFLDSSAAVRELGFTQTPLEVTINDAIAWLANEGLIK